MRRSPPQHHFLPSQHVPVTGLPLPPQRGGSSHSESNARRTNRSCKCLKESGACFKGLSTPCWRCPSRKTTQRYCPAPGPGETKPGRLQGILTGCPAPVSKFPPASPRLGHSGAHRPQGPSTAPGLNQGHSSSLLARGAGEQPGDTTFCALSHARSCSSHNCILI